MNYSITRASELHKDHNFYDYVTFNFISYETEALNGWKNSLISRCSLIEDRIVVGPA